MDASSAVRWATESAAWLFPALTVLALGILVRLALLPRVLGYAALAMALLTVTVAAPVYFGASEWVIVQVVGWSCATVSLALSISTRLLRRRVPACNGDNSGSALPDRFDLAVALFLGAVSFACVLVLLLIRLVYGGIELVRVVPVFHSVSLGFGSEGLWTIGLLAGSLAVAFTVTRDRRLLIALLWIAVVAALWISQLQGVFETSASGMVRRSGGLILLMALLVVILVLASLLSRRLSPRRTEREPEAPIHGETATEAAWPGLNVTLGVLGVAILLLGGYHLAVPIPFARRSFGVMTLWACVAEFAAAGGLLLTVSRRWHGALADSALGLVSLGLSTLAVACLAPRSEAMAERYPVVFNAMIVGLAMALGLCTYLTRAWRRGWPRGGAWANAGQGMSHTTRMAFLNAILALLLAVLMALWPRFRTVATPDFSLQRVTAGFGANLLLLLMMLWSSRELRRPTFHVLTVLSVLTGAGFLVVRMLPFSVRTA